MTSLIVAAVRRISGAQAHLGGWQRCSEEEKIPRRPPLLVCWNTAVLQVRGENKEAVVRIETGHVPLLHRQMKRGRGETERSFGLTRHVSQPGGTVTSTPSISCAAEV